MRKIAILIIAVGLLTMAVLSIASAESVFQQLYDAIKGKSASSQTN